MLTFIIPLRGITQSHGTKAPMRIAVFPAFLGERKVCYADLEFLCETAKPENPAFDSSHTTPVNTKDDTLAPARPYRV